MFSKRYEGVKDFGVCAEDHADRYGIRDALDVLEDALALCREQDMRTDDVRAALSYLERMAPRRWPFVQFRQALDLQVQGSMNTPEARRQGLAVALRAIRRSFGQIS